MSNYKNLTRWIIVLLAGLLWHGLSYAGTNALNSPLKGSWQTIDDSTQQPRSIIKITQSGDNITGKIVKINFWKDENPTDVCKDCTDSRKNQLILGMTILTDVSQNDGYWSAQILDPKNGKVYQCRLTLEDANTLIVRGYVGIPLFGRTQIWHRVNEKKLDDIED